MKLRKGTYAVTWPSGKILSNGFANIGEAVRMADTYLWEHELFYVLLYVIDSDGVEVETVSVEH